MSAASEEQVAFVREALRDALGVRSADLHPGAQVLVTEGVLDQLARVGVTSALTWLIEASKDGKTSGSVEVNADDALRGR